MIEHKTCTTCEDYLPLSKFYICSTSADGYAGRCMQCQKDEVYRQREVRKANGLSVTGAPLYITMSEVAIERERHKRRIEKEIELRLKEDRVPEHVEPLSFSVFKLGANYLRQPPEEIRRRWFCPPKGTCSI
jgi:hypothetical protein